MKHRRLAVSLAILVGLTILAIALPVGFSAATGQPAWLLICPVLLLVLLGSAVEFGLAGSHGNLPALIAGQLEPRPSRLSRDISARGGGDGAVYSVRVDLELAAPQAELSARYLSLAIDVSQLVGAGGGIRRPTPSSGDRAP